MNAKTKRNIAAESVADQVRAALREGDEIPDNLNLVAAAARTIRVDDVPFVMRDAVRELLDSWAEDEGVDRPDEKE